jgi:hypothetical protein
MYTLLLFCMDVMDIHVLWIKIYKLPTLETKFWVDYFLENQKISSKLISLYKYFYLVFFSPDVFIIFKILLVMTKVSRLWLCSQTAWTCCSEWIINRLYSPILGISIDKWELLQYIFNWVVVRIKYNKWHKEFFQNLLRE